MSTLEYFIRAYTPGAPKPNTLSCPKGSPFPFDVKQKKKEKKKTIRRIVTLPGNGHHLTTPPERGKGRMAT